MTRRPHAKGLVHPVRPRVGPLHPCRGGGGVAARACDRVSLGTSSSAGSRLGPSSVAVLAQPDLHDSPESDYIQAHPHFGFLSASQRCRTGGSCEEASAPVDGGRIRLTAAHFPCS
eukprot:4830718-Pyramimonas_sp.AAC.1